MPTPQAQLVTPEFEKRVLALYESMAKRLGVKQRPRIVFAHSEKNAKEPFGKTAYYDNHDKLVKLYVTNRHPTDILRSFAHELIHHWQNEHGVLPKEIKSHVHYAQNDPNLRRREMEAYLLGNILFRDWQDENRYGKLNENLRIENPDAVKSAIKQLLFRLIRNQAIASFHRPATSGDMNPDDFAEELARKIELEMNKFFQRVNDRGNWENQPYMVKERISHAELKSLIKERISDAFQKVKNS